MSMRTECLCMRVGAGQVEMEVSGGSWWLHEEGKYDAIKCELQGMTEV